MVVAALGDPPERVEALEALMGVGFARESGRDLIVLLSPHAAALERASRVASDVGRGRRMIVDLRLDRPWGVLPACDAALVMTPGLSAAWAMVCGVPIVALDTPAIRGQFADAQTALLTPS